MDDETGLPQGYSTPATGNCFWRHKWSKWIQCVATIGNKTDTSKEYQQLAQHRHCMKCGKTQLEKLNP
jgi:hypothetical protein